MCASLTEDAYGIVQRDIPRIIEALLSFLSAIEEYRTELHTRYPPPSPEELTKLTAGELAARHDLLVEVSRASDVLSEVEDRKSSVTTSRLRELTYASRCSAQGGNSQDSTDVRGEAGRIQVSAANCEEAAGLRRLQLTVMSRDDVN